jgi:hypothetical protein
MKKYIASAVVTLPSGCVKIDAAQLRTRSHNLTALEDGTHRIDRPVQFKAGEHFEWDGEAPKARAADFSPLSPALTPPLSRGEREEGSKGEGEESKSEHTAAPGIRKKARGRLFS